jgi:hypothetical protein
MNSVYGSRAACSGDYKLTIPGYRESSSFLIVIVHLFPRLSAFLHPNSSTRLPLLSDVCGPPGRAPYIHYRYDSPLKQQYRYILLL